jgi:hypothetical protein
MISIDDYGYCMVINDINGYGYGYSWILYD